MNIKKILIMGLILIAASTLVSTISAEDVLVTNELTLNEVQFKIPDGFTAIEKDFDSSGDEVDDDGVDTEDIDGTVVDTKVSSEFINSANQKLEITVGTLANDKKNRIH